MPHILDGLYDDIPHAPSHDTVQGEALLIRAGEHGEGLDVWARYLTFGEPEEE